MWQLHCRNDPSIDSLSTAFPRLPQIAQLQTVPRRQCPAHALVAIVAATTFHGTMLHTPSAPMQTLHLLQLEEGRGLLHSSSWRIPSTSADLPETTVLDTQTNDFLPNSVLEPGYPCRVSVETARKWLHVLGFEILQLSKGVFIDGLLML